MVGPGWEGGATLHPTEATRLATRLSCSGLPNWLQPCNPLSWGEICRGSHTDQKGGIFWGTEADTAPQSISNPQTHTGQPLMGLQLPCLHSHCCCCCWGMGRGVSASLLPGPHCCPATWGSADKAHGASSPSAHPCHFTSLSLSQPPASAAGTISLHIYANTTLSSCTGKLLLILQNPMHTRSLHQLPWNHIKAAPPLPSAAV